MTAATATTKANAERPPLTIRVPVDELSRYASLTALGTAVLVGAGILSTIAYLSAWNVPAPVIRLDPLTAALRSETVVWQFLLLTVIVLGSQALADRVAHGGWRPMVAAGVALAVLGALSLQAVLGGYIGPVITIVGGIGIVIAHDRGLLRSKTVAVAFAVIALASAFQIGAESGRLIRDQPAWRTPIQLTTRVAVGGLTGTEVGGGWNYAELYLVFRDGEAVYVSRPDAGSQVWIVPAANIMSLAMGGR